jgi:membrane protease YdiL (CAAX protease family)
LVWSVFAGPAVWGLLQLPGAAWCAALGYHLGCGVAARGLEARLGPRPPARRLALLGLAAAALVAAAGLAVCQLIEGAGELVRAWARWGFAPPRADLAFLAYYVVVNPWLEELYWRGALLGGGRARLGPGAARALATLGFLPHHLVVLGLGFGWDAALGLAVPILAAAAAWVAWCERTGSIWDAAATHAGADLGLAIVYLMRIRP